MLSGASVIEERVRIAGPGRNLEGVLAYPADRAGGAAVIAGPHPLLGGDMNNNVVKALSEALVSRGMMTLKFDYGGVGESEGGPADWAAVTSTFWRDGTFAEEADWVEDAGFALEALRRWHRDRPVLVGYSFGCWTIARNLKNSDATAIVLVSPNPRRHDFEGLADCTAPLLVVHSDNDFTCDVAGMVDWFDSIRDPRVRVLLSAGEHFFKGHESELSDTVVTFLREHDILGESRSDCGHV